MKKPSAENTNSNNVVKNKPEISKHEKPTIRFILGKSSCGICGSGSD